MSKEESDFRKVPGWIPKEKFTELVFGLPMKNLPSRPVPTEPQPDLTARKLLESSILGNRSIESDNHSHLVNLINLIGLFYLQVEDPAYEGRKGRFRITSTGWHEMGPGNAGGKTWDFVYRYFCIQKEDGESTVVSFAIIPSLKEQTMLIVAIERNGQFHNSLQLDLDKFVTHSGNRMYIWHNGALTSGKKGTVKRDIVIEFVKEKGPHLIGADQIKLGSLPTNRLITWQDAEALIYNIIEYALIRDELRKDYV